MGEDREKEGLYILRHEYGAAKAKQLYSHAVEGDVDAQLSLARCFDYATERKLAFYWYRKAAINGSAEALYELSFYYEGKYVGFASDSDKARKCLSMAIKKGYPKAVNRLGSKYYSGDGIAQNKENAFKCYLKAAQMGDDEAMAHLGLCYLEGEGVEKNERKAFEWLSKSTDPKWGYYNLAQCYLKGIGTELNIEKGVECLELAVEGKCLDLYVARKELKNLYALGYGGYDSKEKLSKLQHELNRSNELAKGIADSYYSKIDKTSSNSMTLKTNNKEVDVKYIILIMANIGIGAALNFLAYPYLIFIVVPFAIAMIIFFPESRFAGFLVEKNVFWSRKSKNRDIVYVSDIKEKRLLLSIAILALNIKIAAVAVLAIGVLGIVIIAFAILVATGYLIEGSESGMTPGIALKISKFVMKIFTPIVTPVETVLEFIFKFIGRMEFDSMGIEFPNTDWKIE